MHTADACTKALSKYLKTYQDPRCSSHISTLLTKTYDRVLVIPYFNEDTSVLSHLKSLAHAGHSSLLIAVINAPKTATTREINQNHALYKAFCKQAQQFEQYSKHISILTSLFANIDAIIIQAQEIDPKKGVGQARKIGSDMALMLYQNQCITNPWIYQSDGDVIFPENYFDQSAFVANSSCQLCAFTHQLPDDQKLQQAIVHYEKYLHDYYLGLKSAQSPYAYISLGSCMIIHNSALAKVRGFTQRAAGEDFHTLNKLAKIAPVTHVSNIKIQILTRLSKRVPFGTGPALKTLINTPQTSRYALFSHLSYTMLKAAQYLIKQAGEKETSTLEELLDTCIEKFPGIKTDVFYPLVEQSELGKIIRYHLAHQHPKRESQIQQAFDALKTLQFLKLAEQLHS